MDRAWLTGTIWAWVIPDTCRRKNASENTLNAMLRITYLPLSLAEFRLSRKQAMRQQGNNHDVQ